MAYLDLGGIMSSATAAVGRRADITVSDVSRLANDAYFEVVYAVGAEELEKIAVSSTTTGENKVELPTDFHEPISAAIIWSNQTGASARSSYQTLRLVGVEAMDGRNPQPSGTPQDIAFFNSWVELWPSPNSAFSFQLRYRAHPEILMSTDSLPSLSTPWRKAVELKTRENVASFIHDEVAEMKAANAFLAYVATLKTPQAIRQSGEFRQGLTPAVSIGGRRRR